MQGLHHFVDRLQILVQDQVDPARRGRSHLWSPRVRRGRGTRGGKGCRQRTSIVLAQALGHVLTRTEIQGRKKGAQRGLSTYFNFW